MSQASSQRHRNSFTLSRGEVAQLLKKDIFDVLVLEQQSTFAKPMRQGPCVRHARVKIEKWGEEQPKTLAV
jgi:hypothetical protein